MWYLFFKIGRFFKSFFRIIGASNIARGFGNKPSPMMKKAVLDVTHSSIISKAVMFLFLIAVIFAGGNVYNKFFASTENNDLSDEDFSKEFFSKITLLTFVIMLNFYANELHTFMYKVDDILISRTFPNNPNFLLFLFTIAIFYFGFLTINSKLVPADWHLNTTFWEKGKGNYVSMGLLVITGLYTFSNILMDSSFISYMVLFSFFSTSLILNRNKVNVWVIYGLMSLFMTNNLKYIINANIGTGWHILHYLIYAIQIGMTLFGLTKLENYNIFEAFKSDINES